jgi:integrase
MYMRKGRAYWETKKDGVAYNLGKDKKAAQKEFHRIHSSTVKPQPAATVLHLFALYEQWSESAHSPGYHKRIMASVNSFKKELRPAMKVSELLPWHLTTWLENRCPRRPTTTTGMTATATKKKKTKKPVTDNTRHDYASDILGAFTWAVKQRLIPASPFFGFRKPSKSPRAACLTTDEWNMVLDAVKNEDFRDFLLVLRHTGCRPQEARIVEARHCDFKAAKIKFAKGDVPGKPWEREIPLNDAALAILQRCALKRPTGPLLLNSEGGPWTKNSLNDSFQRLKGKLPFRVSCYVARHSFATDLLGAGASAGAVAAILGHRDPTMVLKVYGKHIDKREEHLRECIAKGTKNYRSA